MNTLKVRVLAKIRQYHPPTYDKWGPYIRQDYAKYAKTKALGIFDDKETALELVGRINSHNGDRNNMDHIKWCLDAQIQVFSLECANRGGPCADIKHPVSHVASIMCQSGRHPHCTCDTCF